MKRKQIGRMRFPSLSIPSLLRHNQTLGKKGDFPHKKTILTLTLMTKHYVRLAIRIQCFRLFMLHPSSYFLNV